MADTESKARMFLGAHARYLEFASRGGEVLGVALNYAIHHSGAGCFITRLSAIGTTEAKAFKHFKVRRTTPFHRAGESYAAFEGLHLNKFAIPVFNPGPPSFALGEFADKHDIWEIISGWLEEQAKLEGFTLTIPSGEFTGLLRGLVVQEPPKYEGDPKMVLEFPDLTLAKVETEDDESAVEPEETEEESGEDEEEDENPFA